MSKTFRSFLIFFAASVLILQLFNNSIAQNAKDLIATIKISGENPTTADVSGAFWSEGSHKNPRNLSFLTEYAEVRGLGARISNVVTTGRHGDPIPNTRFIEGEYVANMVFLGWHYQVDLTSLKQQTAAAHVSWINGEIGLLMLDDLLPKDSGGKISARVKLDVPPGWKVLTTSEVNADGEYEIADVEKASFLIGKNWREKETTVNGTRVKLLLSGEWQFSDDEASKIAAEIFDHYAKVFETIPVKNAQIAMLKFPFVVAPANWEADTRGQSITIVSSDMPFKTQSVQRLHEQLRHEIFHLWIPNGVNLSGNYDWFYEGFALYQSLKTGVAVNRISFDDMLDTLSRAYDIDKVSGSKLSLIEASKNRWNGANTQVYARGMLVAFLCDLALLEKSKGKRSVTDLLRELYERHRPPNLAQDGNTVVLGLMRSHSELATIVERNIEGKEAVDWNALLRLAGLETGSSDQTTKLKVSPKLTGSQKDLLNKLGYNNWRKKSEN